MGRKSETGGVEPKGDDRIQLTFVWQGKRVRPSVAEAPTERNLRKWRDKLNGPRGIRDQIKLGAFNFAEAFPDFRFLGKIAPDANGKRTLTDVVDSFLADCAFRVQQKEMAHSTANGYRKVLARRWQPELGRKVFADIRFSELKAVAQKHEGKKKTYNNAVSAIRCCFEHGFMDAPEKNPAKGLKCFRLTKRDRKQPDPFTVADAEAQIAMTHQLWGEASGNYDEYRFFTGLRPSEQIAMEVADCDIRNAKVRISKARVEGIDKDTTKTSVDRIVEQCPRALEVLKRQLALRAKLTLSGNKNIREHQCVFFHEDGSRWHDLQVQGRRWNRVESELKLRERDPYDARHTSVSWNLMLGKNVLWVAKQHGHSVQVMLETYAAWLEGTTPEDIKAIERAMQASPNQLRKAA